MSAVIVPEGAKRCPRCGEVKDLFRFFADRAKRDGHSSYCRPCFLADRARRKGDDSSIRVGAIYADLASRNKARRGKPRPAGLHFQLHRYGKECLTIKAICARHPDLSEHQVRARLKKGLIP